MDLFVQIKQTRYEATMVQGVTLSEEFSEVLDSCSIIIKKIKKIDIDPFEDVLLEDLTGTLRKHFLIANKSIKMVNLTNGLYDFTLDLVSETKALELIVMPNIVFKQPLIKSAQINIYSMAQKYIDTYSPKRKVSIGNNKWEYRQKYQLDSSEAFVNRLSSITCPDISMNNPTLREFLNFLFSVIDSIPVVRNGIVSLLDLGNPTGTFAFSNHENYIDYAQTMEGYGNNLVKDYAQGISESAQSHIVEKIGFRNSGVASMTLQDLCLETSFPIYNINHIYMYSWREIFLYDSVNRHDMTKYLLVKHDITSLVLTEEARNLLNPTTINTQLPPIPSPSAGENARREYLRQISQYQIMTLGFNRGSRNIAGWGYGYSYFDPKSLDIFESIGWVHIEKTYIENIINIMGYLYPYGTGETSASIQKRLEPGILLVESENGGISGLSQYLSRMPRPIPDEPGYDPQQYNQILKLKSFFFEVDYNAITSGRVEIAKPGVFKEKRSLVDNQGGSLASLELEGQNSLYKAARLANELLQFKGRYTNYNDILPLGSQNEDGYIIFKRMISIYRNVFIVNYAATKNFIIKNYFTSVRSRARDTTFISTESSSVSNLNRVIHVCLSTDYCYYDDLGDDYEAIGNLPYLLTSAFEEQGNYAINAAVFEYGDNKYFQEVNTYIVGFHSLCFTTQMRGNVTLGTYINTFYADKDKIVDGVEVVGSMQSNYVVAEGETGATENFAINFVHNSFDNSALNNDIGFADNVNEVRNAFNYLFLKPLVDENIDNIEFTLPGNRNLFKNNGEIVNFTTQIDYSETSKGIFLGKNFLTLNNLYMHTDKHFADVENLSKTLLLDMGFSVTDVDKPSEHQTYPHPYSRPVVTVQLDRDVYEQLTSLSGGEEVSPQNPIVLGDNGVTMTWNGTRSAKENPPLTSGYSLTIRFVSIVGFSSSGSGVGDTDNRMSVLINVEKRVPNNATITSSLTVDFRLYGSDGSELINYLFYNYVNPQGKVIFGWDAFYDNLDLFGTKQDEGNTRLPSFLYLGQNIFFYKYNLSSKNGFITREGITANIGTFALAAKIEQNCFVFYGETAINFGALNAASRAFSKYDLTNLGLIQSEKKVNEVFMVETDEFGRSSINIVIDPSDPSMHVRTVCYFIFDDTSQKYYLVFGRNLDDDTLIEKEVEQEYELKNIFNASYDTGYIQQDVGETFIYKLVSNTFSDSAAVDAEAYYLIAGKDYKVYFNCDPHGEPSNPYSVAYIDMYNWSTNELVRTFTITGSSAEQVMSVSKNDFYYFVFRFECDTYIATVTFNMSLYDYENDLTSAEEETLRTASGTVARTNMVTVYFTSPIYISILEDKNNFVYDNDGMIIGVNKNWAGDIDTNIDNSYVDYVEEGEEE